MYLRTCTHLVKNVRLLQDMFDRHGFEVVDVMHLDDCYFVDIVLFFK